MANRFPMRLNRFLNLVSCVLCAVVCGALPVAAATTYTNPIIADIGPADPSVLYHDGTYYLYVTGGRNYPLYTSPDLVDWTRDGSVFGGYDMLWAPDVYKHTNDSTYLYYTASGEGGIGVASCGTPDGDFTDIRTGMGGIDANLFRDDDGSLYLYKAGVGVMRMSNPTTPVGSWTGLFGPTDPWECSGSYCANEGPWMVKHDGTYYLMYSGSGWKGPTYAVGYATSSSPTGPFTKFEGNPVIHKSSYDSVYGPGHHSTIRDENGVYWVVYHQRVTSEYGGSHPSGRHICIDPMWFDSRGVIYCRPTRGKVRPAPGTNPWPTRDGFGEIEMESHDGCHATIGFWNRTTYTVARDVENGTYLAFRNVDFGTGAEALEMRAASTVRAGDTAGFISVRLGGLYGPELAACPVTGTGGFSAYQTMSCSLSQQISGVHDIVLVSEMEAESTSIGYLDWFRFVPSTAISPPTVTAPSSPGSGLEVLSATPADLRISYALPRASTVELTLHGLDGRCVARLEKSRREAGRYTWTGSIRELNGVYIVRLRLQEQRCLSTIVPILQ